MAAPYLTADEAKVRLSDPATGYGFTAEEVSGISRGDVMAASSDLDAMGPFVGRRTDPNQEREWPRKFGGDLLEDAPSILNPYVTPDAVLDWVALRAYQLSQDDEAPVSSESAGRAGQSFARPKLSRTERLMASLLDPYLLRVGRLA